MFSAVLTRRLATAMPRALRAADYRYAVMATRMPPLARSAITEVQTRPRATATELARLPAARPGVAMAIEMPRQGKVATTGTPTRAHATAAWHYRRRVNFQYVATITSIRQRAKNVILEPAWIPKSAMEILLVLRVAACRYVAMAM